MRMKDDLLDVVQYSIKGGWTNAEQAIRIIGKMWYAVNYTEP